MPTLMPLRGVRSLLAPVLSVFFFGFGLEGVKAQQAPIPKEEQTEAEVLTRGPVHEAFAETIQLDPEPGIAVTSKPPEPVEELAPEQKPEGEHVVWIPGYWAWDDERSQFLWVSGVWRNTPPGRQWVPGYWNPVTGGHQWISGYWAPVEQPAKRAEYLPPPPESLEYGPQAVAPSSEYVWVPGGWVWQGRYVWRPGYWMAGRPDRCWIPASYVWTPDGYVFVDGYWDYPIAARGVLFAPVVWEPEVVYVRRVRYYSPTVVINLTFLSDCLFVRPRYCHYYFGDYYDDDCRRRGYYSSYDWNRRYRGCEPVYAHRRWQHRDDRDWDRRERERFDYRRDNREARPERSYAEASRNRNRKKDASSLAASSDIAMPLSEVSATDAAGADQKQQMRKLDKAEREQLTRKARQERNAAHLTQSERRTVKEAEKAKVQPGTVAASSAVPGPEAKAKKEKVQNQDKVQNQVNQHQLKVERHDEERARKQAERVPEASGSPAVQKQKESKPQKIQEPKPEKIQEPKPEKVKKQSEPVMLNGGYSHSSSEKKSQPSQPQRRVENSEPVKIYTQPAKPPKQDAQVYHQQKQEKRSQDQARREQEKETRRAEKQYQKAVPTSDEEKNRKKKQD